MKITTAACVLTAALAASPLSAALTLYAFDTVHAVDMHGSNPGITGLAKDTLMPLTVNFVDNTNGEYRYAVSRCVPLFLTAMEKPGRYFLYVTVDPADFNVQLKGCRLELKAP
jgi:hypothetical protein